MLIREFALRYDTKTPEEVLHAGEYLERRGELFGKTFDAGNAVSKAAEMLTVFLDEDDCWYGK